MTTAKEVLDTYEQYLQTTKKTYTNDVMAFRYRYGVIGRAAFDVLLKITELSTEDESNEDLQKSVYPYIDDLRREAFADESEYHKVDDDKLNSITKKYNSPSIIKQAYKLFMTFVTTVTNMFQSIMNRLPYNKTSAHVALVQEETNYQGYIQVVGEPPKQVNNEYSRINQNRDTEKNRAVSRVM